MLHGRKANGLEMKTFIRILTCSIVGAASGVAFGVVLFGISTYISMDSPAEANDRIGWAALSAYIGAIFGFALGIIIGFVIGLIRPRKWFGALIGTALCSLLDVYLISKGSRDISLLVWPPLFGAVVGLLAGMIAHVMRDPIRP
jgi:hypothetical protein